MNLRAVSGQVLWKSGLLQNTTKLNISLVKDLENAFTSIIDGRHQVIKSCIEQPAMV